MKLAMIIVASLVVAFLIVGFVVADFYWLGSVWEWRPSDRAALLYAVGFVSFIGWGIHMVSEI
jgi:hypothetical protein